MTNDDNNIPVPIDPKFLPAEKQELSNDLKDARTNQQQLVEISMEAVRNLANLADQAQHPRAYEVLSNLIKTTSDLNKDVIETSEKKTKLHIGPEEGDDGKVVNNNMFIGSPSDLLKMLNAKKGEGPDIDDDDDVIDNDPEN